MSDWFDDDDEVLDYTPEQIARLEAGLPIDDGDEPDEEELTPEQVAEYEAKRETIRFEPKPFIMRETKKILAVADTETDPFSWGCVPEPFSVGFYDGQVYHDWWGPDCVKDYIEFLKAEKEAGNEYLVYMHNGGKFDFHFLLPYLSPGQNPLIMGGRLVKLDFAGVEHRDSFSIIPQALKGYKKTEIDYAKFTKAEREKHKREILEYQKDDCIYLYDLVIGFHRLAGDRLTIASAALPLLRSMHGFETIKSGALDDRFRRYFYGGRCQCFETGILRPKYGKKFYVYDRNSMYPSVMQDELHPISATFQLQTDIDDDTDFAMIVARNDGCLPSRAEDGGLDFTQKYGTFYATGHEIRAGLETGTLRIDQVKHAWKADRKAKFKDFVERFYNLRLQHKKDGPIPDLVLDILYKLILNSAYGKFALNPRKFKQWLFTDGEIPTPQATEGDPNGWTLHSQQGDVFIWCRPNPRKTGFYNVATAASITGAARANLLRNLALAKRPIYCDTDSIICEGFTGELDDKRLGGWKLEAEGDIMAIAGKKMYALENEHDLVKKASKGVQLSPQEIFAACRGQEVIYRNPVPNFALGKEPEFTARTIRKTG